PQEKSRESSVTAWRAGEAAQKASCPQPLEPTGPQSYSPGVGKRSLGEHQKHRTRLFSSPVYRTRRRNSTRPRTRQITVVGWRRITALVLEKKCLSLFSVLCLVFCTFSAPCMNETQSQP